MDLTVGRTVDPTVDSTVGWTVGLTVKLCNIGLTVDPTIDPTVKITVQPVSRTQASDAMTPLLSGGSWRLSRYEAKCVQRTCFQWRSVPLCSDIKGTELPPANTYIDTIWKAMTALQLCRWHFLYICGPCPVINTRYWFSYSKHITFEFE